MYIYYIHVGQTLVAKDDGDVVVGNDFRGNCSNPGGVIGINILVNGSPGGSRVSTITSNTEEHIFVFSNVTRADNGTYFSCSTSNTTGATITFGLVTLRTLGKLKQYF